MQHASEDQLEALIRNELSPRQVIATQRHLNACARCQQRLFAVQEFYRVMREALKEFADGEKPARRTSGAGAPARRRRSA
jgi:anti-sigma factor RsiW